MRVYLSLGTNMGDKARNLETAVRWLGENPELHIVRVSSVYETEPWGGVAQDSFYNLVIKAETSLSAENLLDLCQHIEQRLDRKRDVHWGPRTIDIDILFYGAVKMNTNRLTLPHPYIEQREFVLAPLREIEPEMTLPSGKPIVEVKGEGDVTKLYS